MTNLLIVCPRAATESALSPAHLALLSRRLTPANIEPLPARVSLCAGAMLAVINPSPAVVATDHAACVGAFTQRLPGWERIGSEVPDGAFALVRCDPTSVELVADATASRTLWYTFDEDRLIASTSQRALIMVLRSFQANAAAIPWLLSAGCLGPDGSWDCRLRPLRGGERVCLDRRDWRLTTASRAETFRPGRVQSLPQAAMRLREAIAETLRGLQVAHGNWVLALSGGADCRAILSLLPAEKRPRCVTWGIRAALADAAGDAQIARRVAEVFGIEHTFYETDVKPDNTALVLARFIEAAEGRIDHLSGYMDGMALWKQLRDDGVHGVIRGDQGFGRPHCRNPRAVRERIGLMLMEDFANLRGRKIPGRESQGIPHHLQRQAHESLDGWRDRVNREFRIPVILAALNAIKAHYVEIANPLLAYRCLREAWVLPNDLRTGKKLLKAIVRELCPDIPLARSGATASLAEILWQADVGAVLVGALQDPMAQMLFGEDMISDLLAAVRRGRFPKPLPRTIAGRLWRRLMRLMTTRREPELDPALLTFRVYTVCHMQKVLEEDAQALRADAQFP